jgi:5-methylcytosine-specific restriction protein A
MPRRIASWQADRRRPKKESRPTAAARGYCSAAWRRTRLTVIARDGGVCCFCGCVITEKAQVDHIVEKSKGGTDALENLRLCCLPCHARRHASER